MSGPPHAGHGGFSGMLFQERSVYRLHRLFAFGQVNDDGNFYFAGGNHADAHAFLGEHFKHFSRDTSVTFHADADDGELADFFIGENFLEADFGLEAVDDLAGLEQVRFVGGEGKIGGGRAGAVADVLDDHVHVDGGVAERLEDARGHAGLVGHGDEGDLGLIFVERDAANDDVLHVFGFFFHNGSWVIVQAGTDFKDDAEFLGEFHRARLHDLGAEAGEFEHFIVGNLVELARAGHDARVGGINAVNVRVYLAQVGLERGGERDGRQIGSAPAQRGDVSGGGLSLEPGHDDHITGVQHGMDLFGFDGLDFGLGMDVVRLDARLRTGHGN